MKATPLLPDAAAAAAVHPHLSSSKLHKLKVAPDFAKAAFGKYFRLLSMTETKVNHAKKSTKNALMPTFN